MAVRGPPVSRAISPNACPSTRTAMGGADVLVVSKQLRSRPRQTPERRPHLHLPAEPQPRQPPPATAVFFTTHLIALIAVCGPPEDQHRHLSWSEPCLTASRPAKRTCGNWRQSFFSHSHATAKSRLRSTLGTTDSTPEDMHREPICPSDITQQTEPVCQGLN